MAINSKLEKALGVLAILKQSRVFFELVRQRSTDHETTAINSRLEKALGGGVDTEIISGPLF